MKYNICLVRPSGYIHSDAFLELAQAIAYSLDDLGHQTSVQYHAIEKTAKNIILGCHLLEPEHQSKIPKDSIIINTEQLFSEASPWSGKWTETILSWADRFETWDYSRRNIEKFASARISGVKHLEIGYHPRLARIEKSEDQDIDILFYGSINARRLKIINDLKREGFVVSAVSGLYGEARDRLIGRSKLIVNMHYYTSQIFEVIRVFYLMINSKAVVCEVNPETSVEKKYLEGICASKYQDIVENCALLLGSKSLVNNQEKKAFLAISKYPQSDILASLLSS